MSFWEWLFGPPDVLPAITQSLKSINELLASYGDQMASMRQKIQALSSDYYNGKAAEHAADVAESAVVEGGGSPLWNTVEARTAGGAIGIGDTLYARHKYTLLILGASGKKATKVVDSDELRFCGSIVVFMRHNRVVYAIHESRVVDFELEPRKQAKYIRDNPKDRGIK